jgi:hypothetical protein
MIEPVSYSQPLYLGYLICYNSSLILLFPILQVFLNCVIVLRNLISDMSVCLFIQLRDQYSVLFSDVSIAFSLYIFKIISLVRTYKPTEGPVSVGQNTGTL